MITSNDLYDTALIEYWKVKKNDLGINIWLFKMEACLSFVEVSISTIQQVFFLRSFNQRLHKREGYGCQLSHMLIGYLNKVCFANNMVISPI